MIRRLLVSALAPAVIALSAQVQAQDQVLPVDRNSQEAAALVRSMSRAGETLFVWGFRPELYAYTGLPAGTPFLDSQPLTGVPADRHLTQSEAVDEEGPRANRKLLVRTQPTWILDGLGPYNPALAITRQIEKVFRSLQKISLAVRGLYGEGSQAMGDFYQISNQITLGRAELELVQQVGDIVPVLIDYERRAREFLVRESQQSLHDQVSRAYGILRTAQTISSEETMHLLSRVRMGVNLGLIHDVAIRDLNELFIRTQPAHLQKLRGVELDTADRNIERARYLRKHLNKEDGRGDAN